MTGVDPSETESSFDLSEDVVQRALSRLKGELRARGQRFSMVREAIARAALGYSGHFEAADLVRVLRERGIKDAHVTTVYRTLPLLLETGLIAPALLSETQRQYYERSFERKPHDHIICTRCKKVVEFEVEAFEALQRDIAKRYGFRLEGHVHELLGICHECAVATQ